MRQTQELPAEPIQRLTDPIKRFLRVESSAGLILLLFTVAALTLSNSSWGSKFLHFWKLPIGFQVGPWQFVRTLHQITNDGLMTLFFFVMALELKREIVLGELCDWRSALFSVMAAIGGMLAPAILFLALQWDAPGRNGWGLVMATDTAFVIGSIALLGPRIPQSLRVFMLSLAIVDDVGAILVVAFGYGGDIRWSALGLALVGILAMRGMLLLGVRHTAFYFVGGILIWGLVDASGVHATITGVILGLMTPTAQWVTDARMLSILQRIIAYPPGEHWSGDTNDRNDLRMAEVATREKLSPVERLEMKLHPWVGFCIMPLFALANAGVPISGVEFSGGLTLTVIAAFILGKPVGILSFCWLSSRLRIAKRPPDLNWLIISGGAMLAGIGFTMALFIADLALPSALVNQAKIGVFAASVGSATIGMFILFFATARSMQIRKD